MTGAPAVPGTLTRLGHGPADLVTAFLADVRSACRSGPVRAYLALELAATAYLVARRGSGMLLLVLLIAAGALAYGFLAWTAGRMSGARGRPDVVRAPRAEMTAIALAYVALSGGLLGWWPAGGWLSSTAAFRVALAGWVLVAALAWIRDALRAGPTLAEIGWAFRSWLPFWPLMLALVLPKLPVAGPALIGSIGVGLASGVTQQVLLQVGLTARLEAFLGRADAAAVLAALGFGAAHVAMNLPQAGGDWWIAAANAAVLQTTIGLVFCLAYLRHRAPLALGFCHALLMA